MTGKFNLFEGTQDPSNINPLRAMKSVNHNPSIVFTEVQGYDHFSELAHTTPIAASMIVNDNKGGKTFGR